MTFVPMQIDNNSTHIPYLMYIEAHELGFKMEGIVNFDASDSLVWSTRLNRDGSLYDVTAKKLARCLRLGSASNTSIMEALEISL